MIATAANSAWLAACVPEYVRFRAALSRVQGEQERVLLDILRKNEESDFGSHHGFSKIRTVSEYQQRVPLSDYEEYRGSIDRIAKGEGRVLTCEPVRLFEPTSGSAGAAKWIPYTASLQREFQRGIRAWVADMFLHNPDLLRGSAYWSISPAAPCAQVTPSGIPVGFADDSEYFGGFQRRLVQSVMAVPASIRKLRNVDAFWDTTLRHLVRRRDLRFISVWNPSFLTLLMERLARYCEHFPHAATPAERHVSLWPHLRMISCWADGNSAPAARRLASLFPQARICGKGLIATEALVTFPWEARGAAMFAVRSHFAEFLPMDGFAEVDAARPQLAYQLDEGQRYSVVVTTGGGSYRYHLGDVVEVVGREQQCPLLRFVGRRQVSDWCGEKLHEAFAVRVLADVFAARGVAPSFAMLACDTAGGVPNYVLYVESGETDERLREIATSVEAGLQENFHYRYARRLGQLGPLRVFAAQNAERAFLAACVGRGQRVGDIKPAALDPRDGWTEKFEGRFVETQAPSGVRR